MEKLVVCTDLTAFGLYSRQDSSKQTSYSTMQYSANSVIHVRLTIRCNITYCELVFLLETLNFWLTWHMLTLINERFFFVSFRIADLPDGLCPVAPSERIECGFYGITKEECLNKSCCWDPTVLNTKWCFKQPGKYRRKKDFPFDCQYDMSL